MSSRKRLAQPPQTSQLSSTDKFTTHQPSNENPLQEESSNTKESSEVVDSLATTNNRTPPTPSSNTTVEEIQML